MKPQFKKLFSIILALLVGVGVILFAWGGEIFNRVDISTGQTSNEWKDVLQIIPQGSSKTLSAQRGTTKSEAATTTTDLLARSLLVNYALLQKNSATTTLSNTDAQALAQTLANKVVIPQGTTYSLKDLSVSGDNSNTALTAYSKKVSEVMQSFTSSRATNELTLVASALTTKDERKLDGLSSIATNYATLNKNLLAIKTPSGVAHLHLRLVQSYANIAATIPVMQKIFIDPVQGLAALAQHKEETAALEALAKEYRDYTPTQ